MVTSTTSAGKQKLDIDRRALIASTLTLGSIVRTGGAIALPTSTARLFSSGELAINPVANLFAATPKLSTPPTALSGVDRWYNFGDLTGKVRIITLWAEWCVPCLAEMADLAALHERYGGRSFEIVAILTASNRKFGYAEASTFLGPRRGKMPLLIEPQGGQALLMTLAAENGKPTLPCNLIVDKHGRIRGRAFGFHPLQPTPTAAAHLMTAAEKTKFLAGAEKSIWAGTAAEALVDALAGDALT